MSELNTSFDDPKTLFRNSDCPFTELFQLVQYLGSNGANDNKIIDNSDTEVLRAIQKHTENIIYELHNGIQHISAMLAGTVAESTGVDRQEITGVSFLINIVANAAEGCADLKKQAEQVLIRRGAKFI